jgi:putative superfamily III holin-X
VSISADGRSTGQQASLGELVALATRDMSLLVRQEIDLAKAELKQQATSAALGIGFLAVAAGLGFGVLIAITIFLGELFTWAGVERFWAYLLTAGVYVVVAGLLALFAANRLKRLHAPERTIQTVKDDVAFLRNPTGSAARANGNGNGHSHGAGHGVAAPSTHG